MAMVLKLIDPTATCWINDFWEIHKRYSPKLVRLIYIIILFCILCIPSPFQPVLYPTHDLYHNIL